MATITEDYVSFEIAKLLKEKGYKGSFNGYYNEAGCIIDTPSTVLKEPEYQYYGRVSLNMAMKWLREVHGLHIWVDYSSFDFNDKLPYLWNIRETKIEGTYWGGTYHKSCEEAVEEAIKYCLENLI